MRIRLERSGTVFEYERPPMPEHRFKALCLLAAGGLYVGLVAKNHSPLEFSSVTFLLVCVCTR